MTYKSFCVTVAFVLLLAGCVVIPERENASHVKAVIDSTVAGSPRLPKPDESALEPTWFDEPLTAIKAVQTALINNPQVRVKLARLDAAQADRVQAGLLSNPFGSLMVLRPNGGGRVELDFSVMQSLFDLFARARRVAVADAVQRRTEAEVLSDLVTLAHDTEEAYYAAVVANALLNVKREQLALEQHNLALAQRQIRSGALSASSAYEQEVATSMRGHDVAEAESALVEARSNLGRFMGLASTKVMLLPDQLPEFALIGLGASTMGLLATRHRPVLSEAIARSDQAKAERALQIGVLRATDPVVGPAGSRESGGMRLNGIAVQVRLPIFDTGRARRDLANAQVTQAQQEEEAIRRQVLLDVERTLATLEAAQQAFGHAERHLQKQDMLLTLAQNQYRQGVGDYRQLSLVQRDRLAAVSVKIQAQQTLWTTLVALERATGLASAAMNRHARAEDVTQ